METTALTLPERELKVLNAFVVRGNELKEEATKLAVNSPSDILVANSLFKQTQLAEKDIEEKRKALVLPFNDFVKQVNTLAKECGQSTAEAKLLVSQKLLAYNEKIEAGRRARAEEERQRLEKERRAQEEADALRAAEEKKRRDAEDARLAEIERKQEAERQKIAAEQNALKKKEMEIEARRLEEEKKLEEQRIANEQAQRKIKEDQLEIERQKKQMEEDERKKQAAETQAIIDVANKPKGIRSGHKFDIVDESKVPRQYCSPDAVKIRAAIKSGVLIIPGLLIQDDKRIQ
jgi:hypothetical protein